MEKILRKVSCKDRLPEKETKYICVDSKGYLSFYNFNLGFGQENIYKYDYWYEEIDLDELITLEKQKYLTELAEKYKEVIPNDLQLYLAKERYEKAIRAYQNWDTENDIHFTIFTALKIAAGLEEI